MADKPSAYGHGAASASSSTLSTSSTVFDSSQRPFNQFSSSPAPFFSSFHTNDARHPLPRHPTTMASNSPPPANAVTNTNTNTNTNIHKPFASYMQMAPPSAPTKKLDISSLMSPPDAVMDSFHHVRTNSSASVSTTMSPPAAEKHRLPMSPPISPYQRAASSHADPPATPHGQPVKDPVLYPHDDSAAFSSPPQPPLFASAELEDHHRIIDSHVRAQKPAHFHNVSPPGIDDYKLALAFRSQVMKHFVTSPRSWLRKERAYLEADKRANTGGPRYHAIMPAKPIASKPPRSHRADRVSKPHAAPRPRAGNNGGPNGAMRPAGRVSATPEPSRRTVAPNREDKDFNSLPDYCPPGDSLPSRANSLKVDWKGQPIDLSGDPHGHLLHPDEVMLAGNLRLDCATYLTSKRRIFERRLQCLRSGKEFRKTDAQQACKIDVNKASKLWTAFDKVGWLDAKWVQRFR